MLIVFATELILSIYKLYSLFYNIDEVHFIKFVFFLLSSILYLSMALFIKYEFIYNLAIF